MPRKKATDIRDLINQMEDVPKNVEMFFTTTMSDKFGADESD